jgi:hypothetical protein
LSYSVAIFVNDILGTRAKQNPAEICPEKARRGPKSIKLIDFFRKIRKIFAADENLFFYRPLSVAETKK